MDLTDTKIMTPLKVALANAGGIEKLKVQILDDLGDPEKKGDNYVYCFEDEEKGVFKIGVSQHPRARMRHLNGGPFKYNLKKVFIINLYYRQVSYAAENYLHTLFRHKKDPNRPDSKEWFTKLTDSDIELAWYTLDIIQKIIL